MPPVEPACSYVNTQRRDPWRWWAKLFGSAYALVGGTPTKEAMGEWPMSELKGLLRSLDKRKSPVAFFGVGIENLHCGKKRALFTLTGRPKWLENIPAHFRTWLASVGAGRPFFLPEPFRRTRMPAKTKPFRSVAPVGYDPRVVDLPAARTCQAPPPPLPPWNRRPSSS